MNRTFTLRFSGFLLLSVLFISCAGILHPQHGPNMLNSEPSGADVYDANNVKLGTTPFDLQRIPQNARMLTVRMSGYRDAEIGVRRDADKTVLLIDAILLCIPCPVDLGSTSLYDITPKNPTVKLRKELPERDGSIRVAIDKVTLENNGPYNWKINGSKKKLEDKGMNRIFGAVDNAEDDVKSAFAKTYLDPLYLSEAENVKSGISRPRVIIRPVLKQVDFDLAGKNFQQYTGPESVKCDWEVMKISDKSNVITTFHTETRVFKGPNSTTPVLDQLMTEAALDFLEIDSVYDVLQRIEREYLSDTKGKSVTLKKGGTSRFADTKEALKNAKSAVVTVMSKTGFGSGFIVSPDGYIITNYHVIDDEKNVTVKLGSDMKMKAVLVKSNKDYDLALLKIEAEELKTIPIGNSDEAESGDEVYAIGTPLETSLGQTITKGIISGQRVFGGMKFIQTDVSINHGNSGGPLVNTKGEMVGVATMKLSGEGVEGIGFCIPSNSVVEMLNIKN